MAGKKVKRRKEKHTCTCGRGNIGEEKRSNQRVYLEHSVSRANLSHTLNTFIGKKYGRHVCIRVRVHPTGKFYGLKSDRLGKKGVLFRQKNATVHQVVISIPVVCKCHPTRQGMPRRMLLI